MAVLHRQTEEFDERNLFLQVVLGWLALGERLDAVLDREAPERAEVLGSGDAPRSPDPPVLLMLGAIATTRHFRDRLAAAVPATSEERLCATAVRPPSAPDGLRRWLE